MEQDTYSTGEAARILGTHDRRIRRMLDRGDLEGIRGESGHRRVYQASVHAKLEEQREQETTAQERDSTDNFEDLLVRIEDLQYRLGRAESRVELTEKAESTMKEERERLLTDLERERERAEKLQQELEEERGKGFWKRLFGR